MLNRNQKTVWNTYRNAAVKFPGTLAAEKSLVSIPVSILTDRKLSVLESIAVFLKEEEKLTLHEIGMLLNRSDKTIWTV